MSLIIEGISKTYSNGVKALDNLSLEVRPGMFGLLGPNGAGKSSLMRTIATLQAPDSGSIHFNDLDILKKPLELRKILGYLPQDFGVYEGMSARELLDYLAVLKGVSEKSQRRALIQHVLELTNLEEAQNKAVSGYSGGMKRRFGIAQILLNDPELIIVDEPTAGLDPAERSRFLNVLREISSNKTVIFSTHIVSDVNELCQDIAIVKSGKVIQKSGTRAALKELEGQIWTKDISSQELKEMKAKYLVLSTSFNPDNSLNIRIWSEEKPGPEFQSSQSSLSDVYFKAIGKLDVEHV